MKKQLLFLSIASIIGLSGCGDSKSHDNHTNNDHEEMDHSQMNHSSSGEIPEGLKEAKNPAYGIGSKAIMHADHMDGMNDVEALIVGAFDTTVYAISYTPINGEEKVTNHKWVIHEEIKNAGVQPFEIGAEVTLLADHMNGMAGATATIDTAEQTTVYMVDYMPTTGGDKVTNHKWVTENELAIE